MCKGPEVGVCQHVWGTLNELGWLEQRGQKWECSGRVQEEMGQILQGLVRAGTLACVVINCGKEGL